MSSRGYVHVVYLRVDNLLTIFMSHHLTEHMELIGIGKAFHDGRCILLPKIMHLDRLSILPCEGPASFVQGFEQNLPRQTVEIH